MRVAIVDDEERWRTKTEEIVTKYNAEECLEIDKYASGENFLKKAKEYDIVFLDVEMHQIDGFQTATRYRENFPKTMIIILTTHTELSRKGYMVNAFRYVDKTNIEEELSEALTSAKLCLNRNQCIEIEASNLGKVSVMLSDILYIETLNHSLCIHTNENEYTSYTIRMSDFEEQLKDYGFFRCHKSYIVNLDKIKGFTKSEIQLRDGSVILVSVRKYQELKRQYLDYKFKYANS